jgi:hypothetical protein
MTGTTAYNRVDDSFHGPSLVTEELLAVDDIEEFVRQDRVANEFQDTAIQDKANEGKWKGHKRKARSVGVKALAVKYESAVIWDAT